MAASVELSRMETEVGGPGGFGGPQRLWSNFPAFWPCMGQSVLGMVLEWRRSKVRELGERSKLLRVILRAPTFVKFHDVYLNVLNVYLTLTHDL